MDSIIAAMAVTKARTVHQKMVISWFRSIKRTPKSITIDPFWFVKKTMRIATGIHTRRTTSFLKWGPIPIWKRPPWYSLPAPWVCCCWFSFWLSFCIAWDITCESNASYKVNCEQLAKFSVSKKSIRKHCKYISVVERQSVYVRTSLLSTYKLYFLALQTIATRKIYEPKRTKTKGRPHMKHRQTMQRQAVWMWTIKYDGRDAWVNVRIKSANAHAQGDFDGCQPTPQHIQITNFLRKFTEVAVHSKMNRMFGCFPIHQLRRKCWYPISIWATIHCCRIMSSNVPFRHEIIVKHTILLPHLYC